MPYFLNCRRCNEDNSYSTIKSGCGKCDGTGRDWRDDHELENLHSWSKITIEELKSNGVMKRTRHSELFIFTYRPELLSVDEDKQEVKNLYGYDLSKKDVPMIFGDQQQRNHEVDIIQELLKYNKKLHDSRYYFPNRCEGCKEYASTRGDVEHGKDKIFCNIGGEVYAEDGCREFEADVTAGCSNCWNYIRKFNGPIEQSLCNLHGELEKKISGYCPEHVRMERTEEPIPPAPDCVERSREMIGDEEYPRDPAIRKIILDAMRQVGISETITPNLTCCNCKNEVREGGYMWGYCSHHNISLLCQDDRSCDCYAVKDGVAIDKYPKISISAQLYSDGTSYYQINEHLSLCAEPNHKFSIVRHDNLQVLTKLEDYMLRAIKYDENDQKIHVKYVGEEIFLDPKTGKILEVESAEEQSAEEATWYDSISEKKYFEILDNISSEQRRHEVYSGNKMQNCERCKNVTRDGSYPDGSPTGLKCGIIGIPVTANAVCDKYDD